MSALAEGARAAAISPAPQHLRVSIVGGRTAVDLALPADIPVAALLPEVVKLVRSRDDEAATDTPWAATRDTFWVLSRLDPPVALAPRQTLRGAGVADGELLELADQREQPAPTLYDDVVDAAARINKAAYPGWNAAAARCMAFAGLAATALVWVYVLVGVTLGAQRPPVAAIAGALAAAMVGAAALARRSYRQAVVAAAIGWSAIPIGAALMWALARPYGAWGIAAGCAGLVAVNTASYRAIGTGRWGYLASGVVFAAAAIAMLGHAAGAPAGPTGMVVAALAALACLTVPRLTGRTPRLRPAPARPPREQADVSFDAAASPPPPAAEPDAAGTPDASMPDMPTAEAVWASVRAATAHRSALYAGLAGAVICGVALALRVGPGTGWAALVFAELCAGVLGVHAGQLPTLGERAALAVPAVALGVGAALHTHHGGAAIAWAGSATLLAAAAVASIAGLMVAGGRRRARGARVWAYLHYTLYAALIPVAVWAAMAYAHKGFR